MLSPQYQAIRKALSATIAPERLIDDELRTLTYGTDASFYRLIPKLVVAVESESEVVSVLREAQRHGVSVTFRAAGTSLSGQAISDSILLVLGPGGWRRWRIEQEGARIRLEPGVVGAHANRFLAPYGRKIGPDPASINSAMIGGIAANNASGMCCGTAQNSYRTVASMRIVFSDGAVLDTGDPTSRQAFAASHSELIARVKALSTRATTHTALADRIRRKYKMKNTTGYSLNALIDFDDPIDTIEHLMIGSEGTLGFISSITYETVPEHPYKSSALMLFADIATACGAVTLLKQCPVDAVELMDRASLRSVEGKDGMPGFLSGLGPGAAALLVETRAPSRELLVEQTAAIAAAIASLALLRPLEFTDVPVEFAKLWNIRKGLFPSVGAVRATGTTVIIEDVTFPLDRLAEATVELQGLLDQYGYPGAIIFGHALEGNLHFVFAQDFNRQAEIDRYSAFMDAVAHMVVGRYDGALKAEHGTGRNMAPFVELEWGREAYGLMQEIKELFDPKKTLNPGVILNDGPRAHLSHLKPLPPADPIVDKCIECGFCEVKCPSRNVTLTPRQRIAAYREMSRLGATGEDPARLRVLQRSYDYYGIETCAADGLCATSCPVSIDTGKLVKELRYRHHGGAAHWVASLLARNMGVVVASTRTLLNIVHALAVVFGGKVLRAVSGLMNKISRGGFPVWNPFMPKGADRIRPRPAAPANPLKVVYFPSCINRAMGPAHGDPGSCSVTTQTERLLRKAGFDVVYPERLSSLCCGMAFSSKGFKAQGARLSAELETSLLAASNEGAYPIYFDTSPCLYNLRASGKLNPQLRLYDPAEFVLRHLAPRLEFHRQPETVTVHATCSTIKMGLEGELRRVAELCADKVVVPPSVGCCGWAGDRGFTYPELNASALRDLRSELPEGCTTGYSTGRTCEIGLSFHAGIRYQSIAYLVDRCTTPKTVVQVDEAPRAQLAGIRPMAHAKHG